MQSSPLWSTSQLIWKPAPAGSKSWQMGLLPKPEELGCNKHAAVRIIFPHYFNDLSVRCFFLNRLLDVGRERFQLNLLSGMFSRLSARAESKSETYRPC